jgi:hypothetical protein
VIPLRVTETSRGLVFAHRRSRYPLQWPPGVWKKLPAECRAVLADNLAHVLSIDIPLVAHKQGVVLNRPRPCFWAQYRTMVLGGIPQAVEIYREPTTRTLERFRGMRYEFAGDVPRVPPSRPWPTRRRAVVLFSSGKDSLTTLGLAREMGLDPVPVYIDDTVSPTENRLKRERVKELRAMGFPAQLVVNRVEELNDFERWGRPETCLGYLHLITSFALIALPIARAFRARYVVLGNEQDMNFTFTNKDGFLTYPSFDQTSGWTMQLDMMTRALTGGAVRTMSLIEPLTDFAVTKVLVERYPELARRVVSCDGLDASDEPRWCAECSTCARMAMYLRALGLDPAEAGLTRPMTAAKDARYYGVFDGRDTDHHERTVEAKEEQELAFHLAIERGLSGPLAKRFRAKFRDGRRRDALLAKYLALRPAGTVPAELRPQLLRILADATR